MDVWVVDLDGEGGSDGLAARPTEEERRRAAALTDAVAARRFLRSRLVVRDLLGRRLGVPPASLRVAYTPSGKPYLPDHPEQHISWSRSGRLLLAGADDKPVGVDIERLRPVPAALDVLATVYPALPATAEPAAFLPAWTLLEAAVKATGRGLARGAAEVGLALGPGGAVTLRGISGHGPGGWYGRTEVLPARDGLPGAVTAVVSRIGNEGK
ncbi:4'-phosphopantetheinyl transferase family protein [Streptomyces purpurogeneiscleroticus]|uniref:4'-phosphopantetheinyl transferase family protein n=1 Tax=Streptomyces purpurogeneiscleroticus TaxID=68259 RepID=UPI001CC16D87|nr:4'-phosphopantetheinyl transferase superfamily protein [Streptomyces purpurogeneiscleroticus]